MDYDVLIVSRYPPIREGQRGVLEVRAGIPSDKIIEADSEDKALHTLEDLINRGGKVGVIITDLHFGNNKNAGIPLLEAIKARYAIPVIVSGGEDLYSGRVQDPEEDPAAVEASVLRKDAFAYFHKSWPVQDLVDKVKAALAKTT